MSAVRITIFQVTPYAEESSASMNEIYTLFGRETSPHELTRALARLIVHEQDSHKILQRKDSGYSWGLDYAGQLCETRELPDHIHRSLQTAHVHDNLLFNEDFSQDKDLPYVFVLVVDDVYAGHAYVWNVGEVTNIIAPRFSVGEHLIQQCGAYDRPDLHVLIESIASWSNQKYLRFIQPADAFLPDLQGEKFVMAKKYYNVNNMRWLFEGTSLGDNALPSVLLFREMDYVKIR